MLGYDYSWGRPNLDILKALGVSFVCRYLSYDGGKNLTHDEAQALLARGIGPVANWETTATRADDAGFDGGASDAREALKQAMNAGMPVGRPIYFSVDQDTSVGPKITSYFQGIASALPKSQIGVYGSFTVVKQALDANLATWAWQTYAWSRGQWDQRAHIRQVQNSLKVAGADVDMNYGMKADIGQWNAAVNNPNIPPQPKPEAPPVVVVKALQKAVRATQDGIWGPDTNRRLELVRQAGLRGPSAIDVKALQAVLGVSQDGVVGPKTFGAWVNTVKQIQMDLWVWADGIWGPTTDAAYRSVSPYA